MVLSQKKGSVIIPPELIGGFEACASLYDNEHWAVYISLMEDGDRSVASLANLFDGTYHEVMTILDDLEKGHLVESFTIWDDEVGGDLSRLFYRASITGYRFYARLFDGLIPTRDVKRWKKMQERTQKTLETLRKGE